MRGITSLERIRILGQDRLAEGNTQRMEGLGRESSVSHLCGAGKQRFAAFIS
jgi:hypothetical protein